MPRSARAARTALATLPFALLALAPAHAADIIVDVPEPVLVEPEPVYSWSGFYAGVHGGYAFSGDDGDTLFDFTGLFNPTLPANTNRFRDTFDDDSGFAGAQVGVLFESSPFAGGSLVFGADADVSYLFEGDERRDQRLTNVDLALPGGAGLTDQLAINTDVGIEFIGHARAQVGVSYGRVMAYVAGGIAFSDADFDGTVRDLSDTNNGVPELIGTIDADGGDVGYTIGGGVNVAFTERLFTSIDYRYTDLGDQDIRVAFNDNANNGPFAFETERDLDFHQVRVGLNFKFN